MIEAFIKDLPQTMSIVNMLALTKNHFNISTSKFYFLHARIWKEKKSFKDMVKVMDEKKY